MNRSELVERLHAPSGLINPETNGVVLNQFFNGAIDEVAVYNRALTATEIKDHCHAFVNKGGIDSPGTIKQFEGSWMELDTHGNQESLSALKLVVIAKLDCVGKFGDFSEANSKISMRKGRYIQEIQNMHKGEYREYFAY